MEKLGSYLNQIYAGLIAGLIGPWIGAGFVYLIMFRHKTIEQFIELVQYSSSTHSAFISVSLIFNLVFFFIALKYDWYRAAKGVILSVFLYAPFVVYFKYVA